MSNNILHKNFNKKRTTTANAILVLLARQKGLEPLTFWFVAKHSIRLSYWRKKNGGEKGIRTLGAVIATHTISNRAPSASSDISPYLLGTSIL